MTAAGWLGRLQLNYTHSNGHTRAHDAHQGPLRVLQALYPEGPHICHHVLVHPPGGVVGGDVLQLHANLAADTHALITTPSATRFYRSGGRPASQSAVLHVASGARLEWLPLEAMAYPGCEVENAVTAELAPGAEMMGWDVLALGLPHSKESFTDGTNATGGWFRQHLEIPGVWLERGRVQAADAALLQSPLAWAGHTVMATLWWAEGAPIASTRREALLETARHTISQHALAATVGVTAPQAQVLVLRALARRVEVAFSLLMAVRAVWRKEAWGLAAEPPRVWCT
jgi:urease accessory protein